MMKRILLICLLIVARVGSAASAIAPPGLLPTSHARALLDQDPSVAAARAGLEVALQEAGILDQSPYEWTARAASQQRRQEGGSRYSEWNVGIEKTLRLPAKATADRNIAQSTIAESRARYGRVLLGTARELMEAWVEWLAAERAQALAQKNLQAVQASLAAVERRTRAGDASKLDLSIARAELAEQRRMENDAKTQTAVAWSRLSTRFPGISRQVTVLPMPEAIDQDASYWQKRILEQSDELKLSQVQMQKAAAQAERARAEKIPDPTLGVYTASEVGGRERVSGITISIPIPGGARASSSAKAIAAVEVSRQEAEHKRRQVEADIAAAVAMAKGSYESLQIAGESAIAMQENARLMQRAYELGEAELQALLLARRQAITATTNALLAQVVALKSYYGLLVDAHLIWDLGHDK